MAPAEKHWLAAVPSKLYAFVNNAVTSGSGEGRLLLAISASLSMVAQAACTAPDPFGTSLATRALSAMSVPMSSPSVVPLVHTDMRCAAEPCWSAPAHEVRVKAHPVMSTRDGTRSRRLMWP